MRAPTPLVRLLAVVAVAALGATVGACGGEPAGGGGRTGRVVRVVDGDTIRVALGGRPERVRYIGIDTPESVMPGAPAECFGRAAARANARLVAGRRVRVVTDAEERDRYGRLLAYVFRADDGRFVNAALVRDGFAVPLTVPPNVRHAARFRALARGARAHRRGLWGACGGE
jgi:micrococcal nuclease